MRGPAWWASTVLAYMVLVFIASMVREALKDRREGRWFR